MRILMTTMKLDIGGAETHIIELSKALARRGIEVTVASNGGAYEKELQEAGIEHVKIPFHSKNPKCMFRAYKQLKALIFKKRFDVVHAHARIPAFLCSLLQSRYHFRFVTTAHWVFSTKFPYNLLTRWGQRSLAVSDDIKDYLVKNYSLDPDTIRVTINGIDLDKFSKDTDYSEVAEEFNLLPDKTRIVYISRMDESRSLAAHKLIEAATDLDKKIENLEIVVVGGGDDFENVKKKADAVNEALKKRLIIMTNSRTDINKFTASCDLFVGVSRAALEAMACEKPSIIAGNEGYIGIFDEDKLGISIDTNFCCRGCGETTTENLKQDILTVLNSSKENRVRLGAYSRETVKNYYSIDTMADDAVKMYISVIKNSAVNEVSMEEFETIEDYLIANPLRDRGTSSDVILSGYYGFSNSGDDSILYAIIKELKENCPDIKIVVLSNSPKITARDYGVKAIHRLNFINILRYMRKTKLLISGGGSLIQDVTSNKSLIYYLSIIKAATMLSKKVMLYSNGIGPVNNPLNQQKVREVLSRVDLITLRDPQSLEELKRFGVNEPEIIVTADPAFNLFAADSAEVNEILARAGVLENSKYCVCAIRPWKTMSRDFYSELKAVADYAREKYNLSMVFLIMQPASDTKISQAAKSAIKNAYIIEDNLTPSQMLGIVNNAEFVLGMRLHTLIYAAKCGTPVIGIVYDPKVKGIMDYMGQNFQIGVECLNPETVCTYIDEIMKNREQISHSLKELSEASSKKATDTAQLAIRLAFGKE